MWGTGFSPGEVPIYIIHSTVLHGNTICCYSLLEFKAVWEKIWGSPDYVGYIDVRNSSANKVPGGVRECVMWQDSQVDGTKLFPFEK